MASPTLGQVLIYDFPLDTDPGWSVEDQWAYGEPAGQGGSSGGPDPTSGHTGENVYGFNLQGDYPNNMPRHMWLNMPALDFRGFTNVTLHFWRWLGVQDSRYDKAKLQVSTDGVDFTRLWLNPSG